MRNLIVLLASLFLLSSCGPFIQNMPPASARGGYTFDLKDTKINPATPMVARPITDKLFVIIDPGEVEDAFLIDDSTHGIENFRIFFQNSLHLALKPYFSDIVFVGPEHAFLERAHFVARAKADRLAAKRIQVDNSPRDVLHMNWAFAIRPSSSADYLFSFSAAAKSENSYPNMYVGCQQVMTSAMHGLLQAWADKNVQKSLTTPSDKKDPLPNEAGPKTVLAIFDVQDASHKLEQQTLEQLTKYLSTLLLQGQKYSVVPRNQVRARLLDEKKGSYRECMDESCQIELGKAVAAQWTLSTTLIKVGSKCMVTSTLFELKSETAKKGAAAETGCKTEDLLGAMKQIAEQL